MTDTHAAAGNAGMAHGKGAGGDAEKSKSGWEKIATGFTFARVMKALAAILTVLAAVVGAIFAYGQIEIADQQKIATQQQELLGLVVNIEQWPAGSAQAAKGLTGTALYNVQVEYQDELISYAQQAQLIITSLGNQNVNNFEFVQVGKALASTDASAEAFLDYNRAVMAPNAPPDTVAAALRNEASLRYELNQPALGHQEMMAAVAAFNKPHLIVLPSDRANNEAQSYVNDAGYQIMLPLGCQIAESDITAATRLKATSYYDVNTLNADEASYRKHC